MTHKARLLAAVRRQPVDRVPYATYNLHAYGGGPTSYSTAGWQPPENTHTADPSYAELLQRVRERAGAFIVTGETEVGEALSRPVAGRVEHRFEGEGDARTRTTIVRTPRGDLTSLARFPEHQPGMVVKPLITSDEDMENYMSIPYDPPSFNLTATGIVYEDAGDRALVAVVYREPMYAIAGLMNFEDFCVRCVTDLPKGMDVVLHTGGPEICTPPMMPPRLFARLVTPYLTEIIEIIHAGGLLAGIHCHGRVREVFPEILRSGADLLEPIEPPEQGNITIAELMEQAQGRICLLGHIQDQEFYRSPPGFMTRRVEEIARVVKGRTGYIMAPSCTPFQFPCSEQYRQNYLEWLDAAERLLR